MSELTAKSRLTNLFRPRPGGRRVLLGIEAGVACLRIARYKPGNRRGEWALARIDWDAKRPVDDDGERPAAGVDLKGLKLPRVGAICALNSPSVEIFPLSLARNESEPFEAQLIRQAQKHLGDQLAESVLDYAELPETVRRPGDEAIPVLVFAAPRDVVEDHLRRLEKAGLEVDRLLTPACAMARRVAAGEPGSRHLLIAASDDATSISVVQEGDVLFERILPWGARKLEERLEAELDLEGRQGHTLLSGESDVLEQSREEGGGVATLERVGGAVGQVLEPEFRMLGREALGCLRFCDTFYRHVTASSIVLTGPLAGNEPLRASLEERLGIAIRGRDAGLSLPGYPADGDAPQCVTAACCALWKEKKGK